MRRDFDDDRYLEWQVVPAEAIVELPQPVDVAAIGASFVDPQYTVVVKGVDARLAAITEDRSGSARSAGESRRPA